MTINSRFVMIMILLFAVLMAAAACESVPTATQPIARAGATPAAASTVQPASDEEAIRQLVLLEGKGVVKRDLTGLMGLWAADATITDARHTPANADDDARWRGRDAIRERYNVLVFPGNPSEGGDTDIAITITGDSATATSTTVIGSEVSPGGDRWTFVKRDGRWWISSLTYNLEAAR